LHSSVENQPRALAQELAQLPTRHARHAAHAAREVHTAAILEGWTIDTRARSLKARRNIDRRLRSKRGDRESKAPLKSRGW